MAQWHKSVTQNVTVVGSTSTYKNNYNLLIMSFLRSGKKAKPDVALTSAIQQAMSQ